MTTKPLILIDGSSYLFRAYHALPPLTNSKGTPTGAVYGVINMIKKLINDYEPDHIAVVFDPKGKTTRHKLYPDYKANRPEMPEELRCQIQPLHNVIRAMGLPLIIVDGVEADDVIGTLAVQAEKKKLPVLISTGDKDMAQLVNQHVTLINTMSDKTMDRDGVIEKFGVPPELIIDYLALMGDSSDNIPGVPKVGPKTAVKWLNEYGSLDDIISQADKIGGKVGDNLRETLEVLPLSKQLTTIDVDLNLPITVDELQPAPADEPQLIKLFTELEFKAWLSNLLDKHPESEASYQTVLTEKELDAFVAKCKKAKLFAFDTETTSLDPIEAKLVGVSLGLEDGTAVYVPCGHDYLGAPSQLSSEVLLQKLKPLLADNKLTVIGQNLKYDINVLQKYTVEFKAQLFDTMLESYILNSSSSRHDMDSLALKYLGRNTIKFEDIAGKGKKQLTFNQIALEEAAPYAAEDAEITLRLHQQLWPQIKPDKKLELIFSTIEMPMMQVLAKMEYRGVLIDATMLHQQSKRFAKRIAELESEAFTLAGGEFNLSSPKQLQEILFDKLQLPVIKKTPKGAPSTAEEVLQELADDYDLPRLILEYRSLSKLKSTYTDKLPQQINPQTGRVHTSYNQAVTATGRLSSTNPNLQNIPVRSDEGRRIRQAFVAPEGYQILSADYSQIELRIMAHLSQDKTLLAAFQNSHDVHASTASEVFGVPIDEVTSEQRRKAKAINFGLIYGMSAFGLARQINVGRDEAQKYMDLYFERYPGVKVYMEKTRELAHSQGFVETHLGRRLYLPEINASNMLRQRAAERAAINAPMQGTSSDLIKIAMIKIDAWLTENHFPANMIMQVHDELIFEVAAEKVAEFKPIVTDFMVHAMDLTVPIEVGIGVGENWDAAH